MVFHEIVPANWKFQEETGLTCLARKGKEALWFDFLCI